MRIGIIAFTLNGGKLAGKLRDGLNQYHHVEGYYLSQTMMPWLLKVETSLKKWAKNSFKEKDALIFIGATGIAVRTIAPFIESKDKDPAVLVIDERGENVISLLSGHIGGANQLTKEVAKLVGGKAIISTATDLNGVFAVDEWAKKEQLIIKEIRYIKAISSTLLRGEEVGFKTLYPIEGKLPKSVVASIEKEVGIVIDLEGKETPFKTTLHLIPERITLGIGCKRGTSLESIEALVLKSLEEKKIALEAVKQIATIDLKKEEEGLLAFCSKYQKPLITYTSDELRAVPGEFTASAFVEEITSVDNVCERAAVCASLKGELLLRKTSLQGVTLAISMSEYKVHFR